MRNVIVALLVLWCCGCEALADMHRRRIAEVNLVQAEANMLNNCAHPKQDGLPGCQFPAAWPYTSSRKTGEVPSVSLIPQIPLLGTMEGMVIGSEN